MEGIFFKLLESYGAGSAVLVFLFMLHKQAISKINDVVVSNEKQNTIMKELSIQLSLLSVNDATQDTKISTIDGEIIKLRDFKHDTNNVLQNHGTRIRNLEKSKV